MSSTQEYIIYKFDDLMDVELEVLRTNPKAVFDEAARTVKFPNPELEERDRIKKTMEEAKVDESDIPPVPESLKAKLEAAFIKEHKPVAPKVEETKELVLDITDSDRTNFLRCILGNGLFTKQVPILGGKVLITFRERSVIQEKDCCDLGINAGVVSKVNALDAAVRITEAQTAYSLAEMTTKEYTKKYDQIQPHEDDNGVEKILLRIEELARLPRMLYSYITQARIAFDSMIEKLYKEMSDPK